MNISEEKEGIVLQEDKYSWYQVDNLIFTSADYMRQFMNSILSSDRNRDIIWINDASPFLYKTRWRPDFCFIYVRDSDIESLDLSLIKTKAGLITQSKRGYMTYKMSFIQSLITSNFYAELIGKEVKILRGPLEDFYGRVLKFDDSSKKYVVSVKLLASVIEKDFNISDFCLKEVSINESRNIFSEREVL